MFINFYKIQVLRFEKFSFELSMINQHIKKSSQRFNGSCPRRVTVTDFVLLISAEYFDRSKKFSRFLIIKFSYLKFLTLVENFNFKMKTSKTLRIVRKVWLK